jgi:hypothetical protein
VSTDDRMEPTVRGARTQSGIAQRRPKSPNNGRPKAEITGTLTKNKGKQKRALSSWDGRYREHSDGVA